jgi:hypothetical protein
VAAYSCHGTKIVDVWDFGAGRIPFADYASDYKSSLTISAKPVGVGAGVAAIDSNGRTIWIADGNRDDGKRFVVRADEKLTAFLELQRPGQFPEQIP